MSPMEVAEKIRENKLRRIAERRGFRIEKSRRKDPHAIDFGGYMLINVQINGVVIGGNPFAYSASLDDIDAFFNVNKKSPNVKRPKAS